MVSVSSEMNELILKPVRKMKTHLSMLEQGIKVSDNILYQVQGCANGCSS